MHGHKNLKLALHISYHEFNRGHPEDGGSNTLRNVHVKGIQLNNEIWLQYFCNVRTAEETPPKLIE